MSRNLFGSKRAFGLIAAAGLATLASTAQAQTCWVYRPGVPDFDQKRNGLGNDGKNHCVPTSWTNWFAFFVDNGYDGLMGPLGPGSNWQSNSLHSQVTVQINNLGTALGTNPNGGTSASEQQFLDYVNSTLDEPAFILRWADGIRPENFDTVGPSPKIAAGMLKLGGAVNMAIGWAMPDSGSPTANVHKDGSHVVSLNGVYGLCSSQMSVRWRDPGTAEGLLSQQSQFFSEKSTTTQWTGLMRFGSNPTLWPTSAYELDAYGDRRAFIFGFRVMLLNFGVGIDTQSGGLIIHRPQSLVSVDLPQNEPITFPGNALVTDFDFLPHMTEGVAVVGGARPALWKIDLAFGEHVKLADLTSAGPVTTSRFGDIYVADGSKIRRFDPNTEREVGFVAPGVDVMALAYDDSIDELLGVGIARGELVQIGRELSTVLTRPLPSGFPLSNVLSIDVHPITRRLWISSGDGSMREMTRPRSGPLTVSSLKILPGVTRAERLRFLPDGGVLVDDGSGPAEFQVDPGSGRFIPGNRSGFANSPIDGLLTVGRSRDDTPLGRENEIDPELLPPGPTPDRIPDCVADLDANGLVELEDFFLFFGCFDLSQQCADLDGKAGVDLDDFFAFFDAWAVGC